MPTPPSTTNGSQASQSRTRASPRRHLPIPIIGKNSKPQVMVVESPALVLALLSKGTRSKNRAKMNDPVIPEAASYMNNSMTEDDLLIAQSPQGRYGSGSYHCHKYRMMTVTELKLQPASSQRSTNILDRFEKMSLSDQDHHEHNDDDVKRNPNQKLYASALRQDIQIFPAVTLHLPPTTSSSSSSSSSSSTHHKPSTCTTPTTPLLPPSPNPSSSSSSTNPNTTHSQIHFLNRSTSSPLILYAAPLPYLFILQLYRISHDSFTDIMTSMEVQIDRAASLLDLLRRREGGHSEDKRFGWDWVRGMAGDVCAGGLIEGLEGGSEGGNEWIEERGEGGLKSVFEKVERALILAMEQEEDEFMM